MAEKSETEFDERYRGRCMTKVMIEDPNSTTGQSIKQCADMDPRLVRNSAEAKRCVYECLYGTRNDAICLECFKYRELTPDNDEIIRSRKYGFISVRERNAKEIEKAARQSRETEREITARELKELEEMEKFLSDCGIKRMKELRRLLGR